MADIELGPKESVSKKIEIKDIWVFSEEEINVIKKQAEDFANVLKGTQYDAQGAVLKNDIQASLDIALVRQKESYSSPQDHIVVYRENEIVMAKANENLNKIKDLVVESGASKGLFGKIGGIQVFATWGIILAILFGFGCLTVVMLSMWKNQAMLAEEILNKDKKDQPEQTIKSQVTVIVKEKNEINKPDIFFKFRKILIWLSISIILLAVLFGLAIKFLPKLFGTEKIIIDSMKGQIINNVQHPFSEASPTSTPEISLSPTPETSLAPTPEAKSEAKSEPVSNKIKILKTSTGWLNVRKEDSLDAEIITKVYSGEEYIFSKERNEWYQIILKDDRKGWVNGVYVEEIK
ncbi:MAG: SH3 domain-containing protein [Candidatus Nealsonbacteria bacterium]|nr:SH3 domain-containing protein [Candidatus Nealsonbacteria bacterium]